MTASEGGDLAVRWADRVRQAQSPDDSATQASVDTALTELELLPPGRCRAAMAEELVRVLVSRSRPGDTTPGGLGRLVQIGDEDSPYRPGWRLVRASARTKVLLRAITGRESIDSKAVAYELDQLVAEFPDVPGIRLRAAIVQAHLSLRSHNEISSLHEVLVATGKLGEANSNLTSLSELMSSYLDATQGFDLDGGAVLKDLLERLRQIRQLPGTSELRYMAAGMEPTIELVHALVAGVPDSELAIHDRRLAWLQAQADRPGSTAGKRAVNLIIRGGAMLRQGAERDPARLSSAIDNLREATTLHPQDHPDHVLSFVMLAWALHSRSHATGSWADLDDAIGQLEMGRKWAGGASHPYWPFLNAMLSDLMRCRGDDKAQVGRVAFEGLLGHAYQVLLQPDPISARRVARDAALAATKAAVRSLADEQPVDALRALDTGRGLMLFAATELRDPGTRLVAAGRPELAERWQAEARPPAWLRQDVLEALSGDTELLDPPDLAEIQAALRALHADALVYLGATPGAPGWAVIAPVAGEPHCLQLPDLMLGGGTNIERYLTAMATRELKLADAQESPDSTEAEFRNSVDALCDWAWQAAMGPIVEPYLASERIPHLMLVPMGELGRVPWQAARDPDGRYLVERIAISQAASARMLCDTAAAEPVRLTSTGLIVADPDTGGRAADLRSARLEAYAIRESFYPGATYLGRRPNGSVSNSGAGTPDEVRAWLRSDGAETGAMLHLASHGVMDTVVDSASSRLILAGGDLTASELIGVLAADDRHRVGLAVLAACHTGRSIHGYDEAYSLATMFLASGVRSVLSAQWSVPDQDTSLLMYMFHHYLKAEGRPPWDALRRAQVWMLDDARTVPDRMPALLRRIIKGADPAHMLAWAGFVHWGQ